MTIENAYSSPFARIVWALILVLGAGCSSSSGAADTGSSDIVDDSAREDARADVSSEPTNVRIATFNASLYRDEDGQLAEDLAGGDDSQARGVAETIQRMRPDAILINEFDWDAEGTSAHLFQEEYLSRGQNGAEPIEYPYRYVPETNTGVHSGFDLDNNGEVVSTPGSQSYGNDAFGFGQFPGQYGMVVYSKYPIAEDELRTFRTFLWKDMPDNLIPEEWYSDEEIDELRLSSKTHIDVPIRVGDAVLHLLGSHPTPPSFDGSEDRNGRRNHDEIRFWTDYVGGESTADYIRDDSGRAGGLESGASFVILGDLNSDPNDGDSRHEAISGLISVERVADPRPGSEGAVTAASDDGGVNAQHETEARLDTADFSDGRVGNLRVDYALPSLDLAVEDSGVYWPDPGAEFDYLADVSDHHMVWVEVALDAGE